MHLKKWKCPHCGAHNLKQPKRCEDCNKLRSSKRKKKATRKKVTKKKGVTKKTTGNAPSGFIARKLLPGSYTLRIDVAVNGKPTVVFVMKHQPRTQTTGEWRPCSALENAFENALRKGVA
jgi:hypothetical protein